MKISKSVLFLLFLLLSVVDVSLAQEGVKKNSLQKEQADCAAFKAKLDAIPGVTYGYADVPKDHGDLSAGTIQIFWWKRAGVDSSYAPLLFLHGGVAGNSSPILTRWKAVVDNYKGDLIAVDHRGDGCSKTQMGNLDPLEYSHLRIRQAAQDLEILRRDVLKIKKWRVFGQSRGSWMIHYYLEMFPYAIESAHMSAGFVLPESDQKNQTYYRALGYAVAATEYLKQFPGDEEVVKNARAMIPSDKCWVAIDDVNLCGPNVIDLLAMDLGRRASWPDFHKKIEKLRTQEGIFEVIQKQVDAGDPYFQFNYVMGTNGQDLSNPNSAVSEVLRSQPIFSEPFLSELRFVTNVIGPLSKYPWVGSVDPLNYVKLKLNLTRIVKSNAKVFAYYGDTDTIAPREVIVKHKNYLGSLVKYIELPNTGHGDSWYNPIVLENVMKKNYQ